jgi:Domain of unknown function (DUF222)
MFDDSLPEIGDLAALDDAALVDAAAGWSRTENAACARKVAVMAELFVDRVDPGALRRSRKASCHRDVQFGLPSDEAGFTSMWARLCAPDAVVLQQRVEEMARGVCDDDPRTLGERRSDALTAMAAGIHELACECGNADCPAAGRDATPPATAVIHVVADAATVEAARTEATGGTPPPDPAPPAAAPGVEDSAPATEPDVDAAPVAPASVAETWRGAACLLPRASH